MPAPFIALPLRLAQVERLRQCLRALTPIETPTIRPEMTLSGVALHVKAEGLPPPPAFSGTAYVGGAKTAGLNDSSKGWVKCTASGSATEEYGPAPDPFPADEEWYEKAETYGDIHCDRF